MRLEKLTRFAALEHARLGRLCTDAVEPAVHRTCGARRLAAVHNGIAALAESGEGGGVIVIGPAVELGKRKKLDTSVAEFHRRLARERRTGNGCTDSKANGNAENRRPHSPRLDR
jgi:hypothetical protein